VAREFFGQNGQRGRIGSNETFKIDPSSPIKFLILSQDSYFSRILKFTIIVAKQLLFPGSICYLKTNK